MRTALYFAVLMLSVLAVRAADAPLGSRPGVLLLRNGSVIEGNILREGDRFEVSLVDGDLRVRAEDVEFVGGSLEDCYHHLLAGIDVNRVQDHLELAEWCVRNRLYSAGGRELREAMICDPRHPMIGVLERRLKLAIEEPPQSQPAEPRQLSAPSADELDRLIEGMPPGTVETFTTTIQPMLLNQCSTSGCHGQSATNSLRLMRVAASRTPSRRATQRNLYAVLENIAIDQPDNSPLLTMPIRAHGTSRAAIFTSRQTQQYKQLVDWVYSVANKRQLRTTTADSGESNWPLAQQSKPKPISQATAGNEAESPTIAAKYLKQQDEIRRIGAIVGDESFGQPATKSDNSLNDPEAANADTVEKASGRLGRRILPGRNSMRSAPKRGEISEESSPQDPFDPEEFNRQLPSEAGNAKP